MSLLACLCFGCLCVSLVAFVFLLVCERLVEYAFPRVCVLRFALVCVCSIVRGCVAFPQVQISNGPHMLTNVLQIPSAL